EHRPLRGLRLLAGGAHDHAVGRARVAGDLELRDLLDLDQAHAAVARDREPGMPAVVRDLDAETLRGDDDGRAVLDLDLAAVDLQLGHAQPPCRGTGNGRAQRAARTRRDTS